LIKAKQFIRDFFGLPSKSKGSDVRASFPFLVLSTIGLFHR